jgi:type VII secretion-associated protein (TIGR03931 family)
MERPGVNQCVVEVGPGAIRGPCHAAENLTSTALDCIDDDIAMLDDQPVAVGALWREVFRTVMPERVETAALICPTWWPSPRVELVREAAAVRSAKVVVRQRAEILASDVAGEPTIVEIAPVFVVIWQAGRVLSTEPRLGEPAHIARSVAAAVGAPTTVLVDAPAGVAGAVGLADAICDRLRADGTTVKTVHSDRVLVDAREPQTYKTHPLRSRRRSGHRAAAMTALGASVVLLYVGLNLASGADGSHTSMPMTLLVEGRVALKVPALWAVRRISSGPGSARVEVTAPDDSTAVLITQSQVRRGESLAATSATLRSALDDQQDGAFTQFNPDDRRADRPAATYRELRGARQIDWAVFVDDTVRIGLGCQSAPGSEQAVQDVCEEAIRSAHALF